MLIIILNWEVGVADNLNGIPRDFTFQRCQKVSLWEFCSLKICHSQKCEFEE